MHQFPQFEPAFLFSVMCAEIPPHALVVTPGSAAGSKRSRTVLTRLPKLNSADDLFLPYAVFDEFRIVCKSLILFFLNASLVTEFHKHPSESNSSANTFN